MSQSRARASLLLASVAGTALLASQAAAQTAGPALPTGGVVVGSTPDGQGANISTSGSILTVDQSSRRVVIDWQTFNIGQGGTVNFNQAAANFIALNRINPGAGLTSINGALNANGSVWLFAPGGLLFGPNANVNVGSLFAATATLRNTNDSALTSNVIGYDGPAGQRPSITVEAGAQIRSNAGLIGMHSESLSLGGNMAASGDMILQVSPSGQIAISDTVAGIDYGDSGGLGEVQGDPREVRFSHTGTSTAGDRFFVFAAGGSLNYQGVINLGGLVEAESITVLGGSAATTGGLLTLDTSEGSLTARGRMQLEASALRLGRIEAGELSASARNTVAVMGEITTSGNAALYSLAGDITVADDVTVRSDSDGDGAGSLVLQAARNVTAGAGSLLTAGPLESGPTASVSVTSGREPFGSGNPGGDISVANVAGRSVALNAQSGSDGLGALTVNGSVFGTNSVQLNSFSPSTIRGGDIRILGGVRSNGAVTVNNFNGGGILLGSNATVQSDRDGDGQGGITLQAQRSVLADATSRILAGSGIGAPTAGVNILAGFTIPDGGDITTGAVSGRTVIIGANAGTGGGGQVRVLGDVLGVDSVRIQNGRTGGIARTGRGLIEIAGDISSNGAVNLYSEGAIRIGPGLTLRSDANGDGAGELRVDADTDITVEAGTLLAAGPGQGAPTAALTLDAGVRHTNADGSFDTFGGDTVIRGSLRGRTVDVFGNSSATAGGSVLLEGDVTALDLVRIGTSAWQNRRGSTVTINGAITTNGRINIYNVDGGNTVLGAAARVQGDADGDGVGGVGVGAERDVITAAGSLVLGGGSAAAPTAQVNINAGSGPNAQNTSAGRIGGDLNLAGVIAGSAVNMSALSGAGNGADILLGGTVFGRDSVLARASAPQQNDSRQGGSVRVTGRLASNGRVDVQSYDGGDLEIASTAVLRGDADGNAAANANMLFVEANRNVTVTAGALLAAGSEGGVGTGRVAVFAGYKPPDTAVFGGDLTVAGTIVGGDVTLGASQSATRGGLLTVSGDVTATGRLDIDKVTHDLTRGGSLNVTGRLRSNGRMEVLSSGDLVIGAGALLQSDMDGSGDGGMFVYAANNVTLGEDSELLAGAAPDRPTAVLTVESGTNNVTGIPYPAPIGGDIVSRGSVRGSVVNLQANSGGSVTVNGAVFGRDSVRVRTAALGDLRGGTVSINAPISSNGSIRLENLSGGDIAIAAVAVRSDADGINGGDLVVDADRDVVAAAGSLLAAGAGAVTITAGDEAGPTDGGDVTLGRIEGRAISISALGRGEDVGAITLLAPLNAQGDLTFRGDGGLELGALNIGGNLLVDMVGDVLARQDLTAGGFINLQSTGVGGDVVIGGNVTAGGSISLSSRQGDVTLGSSLVRSGGAAGGGLTISAGGAVTANADSLLSAGGSEGGPAGAISVSSGLARTSGGTTGGDLRLGRVSGGSVNIQSYGSADGSRGDILLAGPITAESLNVGSGSYAYANSAGEIRVLGALTVRDDITLINYGAADLVIGPGAVVRADSDGDGDGSILVDIDGSVLADATSTLAVGGAQGAPTGSIAIVARGNDSADGYLGNGDIALGALSAGFIELETYGDAQGRGLITLAGDVTATRGLTVAAGQQGTGLSGLRVLGDIRSGGEVSLDASGNIEFGPEITVESGNGSEGGALVIASGRGAVSVGAGARLIGGAGLSVEAATILTVAEGALLEGRQREGAGSASSWPAFSPSAENGGVYIAATDLDLRGSIVSRRGDGFGDMVIAMGGDGGATLGGDGSGGGFNLSDAEFQRLSADNLVLGAEAGNVNVRDLNLNGERLGTLWLGAGEESRITVSGTVNSTGPRPVNLRLGFVATNLSDDNEGEGAPGDAPASNGALPEGDRYIPGEIVITGSLGGGGRLGQVSMAAVGDIIMGSDAYLAAAEADPAFDPGRSNAAAPGPDHLFVQAEGLQLAAGSRILQQNTGARGSHNGIRIGRPTSERPLIARYDDLLSADGAEPGPQLLDLHLVIEGEGGVLLTGRQAAEAAGLLDLGPRGPERESALAINGCTNVGALACTGGGDDAPVFQNPIELELAATQSAQSSEAVEGAIQTFLVVPEDAGEEAERDAIGLPVTGSGNEDLWPGALQEVEP